MASVDTIPVYKKMTPSQMDKLAYSGNDLGAVYTPIRTTFKVWSPIASKVRLRLYSRGSDDESGAREISTTDMKYNAENGIWSAVIHGDLAGVYYTYLVTVGDTVNEAVDIYAKAVGVNGKRGMIVDLKSTDPDGWENDGHVMVDKQTDAIIWEIHVKDFSFDKSSGVSEKNRGKFLAFTESGTTVNGEGKISTCLDYLSKLGVNYVHLMPIFDYVTVDEENHADDAFNWGYDPLNYNVPEGSYCSDPFDGNVRIRELKQMIMALHERGIGVVMDVVYNHTYQTGDSSFNKIVPDYYYRKTSDDHFSNASGCGNETASEHLMYRKFMIDSILYWAEEYHIDGFRFDLMGVHDVNTMNAIREALDSLENGEKILMYGEPWQGGLSCCKEHMAMQYNMKMLSDRIAAFNDKMRDIVKGDTFNASYWGFIQGGGSAWDLRAGITAHTLSKYHNNWSKSPSQTVNYASAHDNYTLWDKLVYSVLGAYGDYDSYNDDLASMNKLCAAVIITSQGIPFFQAGEEFARTKHGNHNSYNSSANVNSLNWSRLNDFGNISDYYAGLIKIRKYFSPLRDNTTATGDGIKFFGDSSGRVIGYTLKNKSDEKCDWNTMAIIFNSSNERKTVTITGKKLPESWEIIADGKRAGLESLGTVDGLTVGIEPHSALIMVDKKSFDSAEINPMYGEVIINHIDIDTQEIITSRKSTDRVGRMCSIGADKSLLADYDLIIEPTVEHVLFSEEVQELNYYYKKFHGSFGTVTVYHVDSATNQEIAEPVILRDRTGRKYFTEAVSIGDYVLDTKRLPKDTAGEFDASNKTITYYYENNGPDRLTVHFYNKDNWNDVWFYAYQDNGFGFVYEITDHWCGNRMTYEGGNWWKYELANCKGTADIIFTDGYGHQEPEQYSKGMEAKGECYVIDGEVEMTGKAVVVYISTDGELLDKIILRGKADGESVYVATKQQFIGYKCLSDPSNLQSKFADFTNNVVLTYQKVNNNI
ncbi:MAG: type I pullulanase [Acutalibacteraceae bacterium]